jgi:hypothetical protein
LNFVTQAAAYGISCSFLLFAWVAMHRGRGPDLGRVLHLVLGITLVYGTVLPAVMQVEKRLVPYKYDELLYHLDEAMGVTVMDFSRATPDWAYLPFAITYKSLAWVMTIVALVHVAQPWGRYGALVRAFIVAWVAAPVLYLLVPACGPAYTLAHFRHSLDPMVFSGDPNAIPSMHFGSALLLLIFAGPSVRWRIGLALYLIGIAAGTVLAGEHYFIDWLPSIPLVFAAARLVSRDYPRAAANFAGVLGWLLLIRFAGPWLAAHPNALRGLAVITVLAGARALRAEWNFAPRAVYAEARKAAAISGH